MSAYQRLLVWPGSATPISAKIWFDSTRSTFAAFGRDSEIPFAVQATNGVGPVRTTFALRFHGVHELRWIDEQGAIKTAHVRHGKIVPEGRRNQNCARSSWKYCSYVKPTGLVIEDRNCLVTA